MNRIFSFRTFNRLLFSGFICILLASCKTTQKAAVDTKDLSYLYNPTKSSIKPRYSVFNETDASSVLSIKFFTSDLFFSEANPRGIPMAQILISVKLYNITNGRILADTAFMDIDIVKEESRQEFVYRLPFNTLSYNNRYNFIARGHFKKNELFNPVVRRNEYVNLVYPVKSVDSLFISYYKPLKEVPYPPSMLLPEKTIDYPADTVIALPYSDTLPIMFPSEGIYFCSVGRNSDEGYTFFNFGETFPSMTQPDAMIEPLSYLASEEEMAALRSSLKPKLALDEFWIKCGGNVEKSRELIRIYYTRILYSNYYFTSFKEGWRTERGMIYTIYGPPDKVYKNSEGESWGYRRPVLKYSWGGRYHLKQQYLFFNFRVRQNKYSENDFYLSRSETLITYWDKAIASWRKGMVYRLDNPEDL
jgi:GWxTD domain-containing protein